MKGLILSGGSGTRMRPLTHSIAKQLLPIANQPILHRAINQMKEAGIIDIGIIVGSTAEQVQESVGDGSNFGVNVTYLRQLEPLGLAHCVKIARDFLQQDDFVMFLGDNMFQSGLAGLISDFEDNKRDRQAKAQVAVMTVSNPAAFGVATVGADSQLESVEEKPAAPKSNLAMVGTYCFSEAIHKVIETLKPSRRGELEITDAIQQLVDVGMVVGVSEVSGWWFDTGNPESFLECNARVLDSVSQEQRLFSSDVRIIEPCAISSSAVLKNCTIGPYSSIGPGARVSGMNISNSVLLEGSTLSGIGHLQHSIIGRRSSVNSSGAGKITLILGDDCDVSVGSE